MNRIDRLQAILIHLQSKKVVTAQEIADRFEISIRTVYRDIRALEQAGVPIGAEAGVGYFFADTYHLPPVSLTTGEATALLFGVKFAEQMGGEINEREIESAFYKIKSVLRNSDKEHVDVLSSRIWVMNMIKLEKEKSEYLQILQKSLFEKKAVEIAYYANRTKSHSLRIIKPIGICYYGYFWHVIAFCTKRNDYRDFRVDRIQNAIITDSDFSADTLKSLAAFFADYEFCIGVQKIVLFIKKEFLESIADSKRWWGFTHEEEYDRQWAKLYFRNDDLYSFANWVIQGGSFIKIIEPPELVSIVTAKVKTLSMHYL